MACAADGRRAGLAHVMSAPLPALPDTRNRRLRAAAEDIAEGLNGLLLASRAGDDGDAEDVAVLESLSVNGRLVLARGIAEALALLLERER